MIQNNNVIRKVPGSKLFNKIRKELILEKQVIQKPINSKKIKKRKK